jgi:ribosome-binding factor A
MVSEDRKKRLEDNVARLVAEIVHTELKQPLPGIITITGVELSKDLGRAKVRYTFLGEDEDRRTAARKLGQVSSFVQREVGRRLHMRTTPHLGFEHDDATGRGARVLSLLAELEKNDRTDSVDSE